jgi:hypothetical protein
MKNTIYFNREEGWINILTFDNDNKITTCEVLVFTESFLSYCFLRANHDNNIYIFEAQRRAG